MNAVLEVRELRKVYGNTVALDGVSFDVGPGEVHSIVGPNGAGKTTLMEIASGLLSPSGGSVRLFGVDPLRERRTVTPRLSVAPQFGSLFERLTIRESVALWSTLYASPVDIDDVVARVGLAQLAGRRVHHLSGGEARRLLLALVLVARTEAVLLDEPTTGLDPQGRADLWAEIAGLRANGTTVILSTHLLEEAERLSDVVHVICGGRMLATGTVPDLVRHHGGRGRVRFSSKLDSAADVRRALGLGADTSVSVASVNSHGSRVSVETDESDRLSRRVLTSRELEARDVTVEHGGLEDVFFALTGRRDLELASAPERGGD